MALTVPYGKQTRSIPGGDSAIAAPPVGGRGGFLVWIPWQHSPPIPIGIGIYPAAHFPWIFVSYV